MMMAQSRQDNNSKSSTTTNYHRAYLVLAFLLVLSVCQVFLGGSSLPDGNRWLNIVTCNEEGVVGTNSSSSTNVTTSFNDNFKLLTTSRRSQQVCSAEPLKAKDATNKEWQSLCNESLIDAFDATLAQGRLAHVIQIGAHVGFEENDPLAHGMLTYLQLLTPLELDRFHWTFVEPSPPNFRRLQHNLQKRRDVCRMDALNFAVVPDQDYHQGESNKLTFYSIRDTVDPETGYDSLSHKKLPKFITQVSSFHPGAIKYNAGVFHRKGLKPKDYIVKTNVTVKGISTLIDEVMGFDKTAPDLVLVDTEGQDCAILESMSNKTLLPRFIIFETHCKQKPTFTHLQSLGYRVRQVSKHNALAVSTSPR